MIRILEIRRNVVEMKTKMAHTSSLQNMPLHDRLRETRESLHLTASKVAELSGLGASSISEFENGRRIPSLAQLQKLANIYHRSISFFLEEGPVRREVVLWRERPEPSVAAEIEAQFLKFCRQYRNLETWCDERLKVRLPIAEGIPSRFTYRQASALAKQVRDELQLGDRPAQVLLTVLEEVCGVKVIYRDFEPSGAAASTYSDEFGPAVLLNASNTRWRRNFDLAHEVFHLVTWEVFHSAEENGAVEVDPVEEKFAGTFASALLMPDEPLRSAISEHSRDGKLPFEEIFDIARQFDVSAGALLWRLHSLYRTPDQEDLTRENVEQARRLAPLFDKRSTEEPPERPSRYCALAFRALKKGALSAGRFAEYMGVSRQEAMRVVEQQGEEHAGEICLPPA
ncbi:MAG: helix-turn-helix domain-containing protein [Acidobacteriota bacterium]